MSRLPSGDEFVSLSLRRHFIVMQPKAMMIFRSRRTSENESLKSALLVRTGSVLNRRRERSLYKINVEVYKARILKLIVASIMLIILGAMVGRWTKPKFAEATNRALPLADRTQAHQLNRFNITHTIRDGDTIWGIATRYYGSGALLYQKRLREANPWLPEDPRKLMIGLELKIPLN